MFSKKEKNIGFSHGNTTSQPIHFECDWPIHSEGTTSQDLLAHSECANVQCGWHVPSIKFDLPCNPNVGLHTTAGQLVKNGYNTGLASPLTMELLSDWPVSLQWVQYRSGQSIYNRIIIRLASWSTMGTIQVWSVHVQWV
jgi:hypothetical protein